MLSIPTFKQSGQYYKGSVKLVEIKYEGTGKFLIDLIKEQLDYINNTKIENYTGFLFYSQYTEYQEMKKIILVNTEFILKNFLYLIPQE